MATKVILYVDTSDGVIEQVDTGVDDFTIGGITISGPFGIVMSGSSITGLINPINPQDAATKAYVDLIGAGFRFKNPARVVSETDQSLSGLPTIDGVGPLLDGERVLLAGQTDAIENGLYEVRVGAWNRPADFAIGESAAGAFVIIEEGTINADTAWVCVTDNPNAFIDGDPLLFVEFTPTAITGGDGIDVTGGVVSVDLASPSGLETSAALLRVQVDGSTLNRGVSGMSVNGVPANFDIDGVATASSVTAPALETLTAGPTSDASALHTHASGALPAPDQVGQVLYSDSTPEFQTSVPILGGTGWLVGGGILLVK